MAATKLSEADIVQCRTKHGVPFSDAFLGHADGFVDMRREAQLVMFSGHLLFVFLARSNVVAQLVPLQTITKITTRTVKDRPINEIFIYRGTSSTIHFLPTTWDPIELLSSLFDIANPGGRKVDPMLLSALHSSSMTASETVSMLKFPSAHQVMWNEFGIASLLYPRAKERSVVLGQFKCMLTDMGEEFNSDVDVIVTDKAVLFHGHNVGVRLAFDRILTLHFTESKSGMHSGPVLCVTYLPTGDELGDIDATSCILLLFENTEHLLTAQVLENEWLQSVYRSATVGSPIARMTIDTANIRLAHELFRLFDIDGSGSVEVQEFINYFGDVFFTSRLIPKLFSAIAVTTPETVYFKDFLYFMLLLFEGNIRERLIFVYRLFCDREAGGFLCHQDLFEFLKLLHPTRPVSVPTRPVWDSLCDSKQQWVDQIQFLEAAMTEGSKLHSFLADTGLLFYRTPTSSTAELWSNRCVLPNHPYWAYVTKAAAAISIANLVGFEVFNAFTFNTETQEIVETSTADQLAPKFLSENYLRLSSFLTQEFEEQRTSDSLSFDDINSEVGADVFALSMCAGVYLGPRQDPAGTERSFTSTTGRFTLTLLDESELEHVVAFMTGYFEEQKKRTTPQLLRRFYGLYRVEWGVGKKFIILVSAGSLPFGHKPIHRLVELDGFSTLPRTVVRLLSHHRELLLDALDTDSGILARHKLTNFKMVIACSVPTQVNTTGHSDAAAGAAVSSPGPLKLGFSEGSSEYLPPKDPAALDTDFEYTEEELLEAEDPRRQLFWRCSRCHVKNPPIKRPCHKCFGPCPDIDALNRRHQAAVQKASLRQSALSKLSHFTQHERFATFVRATSEEGQKSSEGADGDAVTPGTMNFAPISLAPPAAFPADIGYIDDIFDEVMQPTHEIYCSLQLQTFIPESQRESVEHARDLVRQVEDFVFC